MSATFTDNTGQQWTLALTFGHCGPLKDLYGFDLNQAIKSKDEFAKLFDLTPEQLVGATWLLCEQQALRAGLTPEQWAYRFDGAAIEGATVALAEAVIGFFPRQKIASAMRGNLRKALDQMDREAVKKIENSKTESQLTTTSSTAPAGG